MVFAEESVYEHTEGKELAEKHLSEKIGDGNKNDTGLDDGNKKPSLLEAEMVGIM